MVMAVAASALPSSCCLPHLSKLHPAASARMATCLKSTSSFPGFGNKASVRNSECNRLRVRLPTEAIVKDIDVSKVVPQADRVLIRLEELPEKSVGGVLLPKSAVTFERYLVGEVISTGKEAGAIEKGQKVMFSDLNAYEVDIGTTEKLCFCKAGDLLAVVA